MGTARRKYELDIHTHDYISIETIVDCDLLVNSAVVFDRRG